MYKLQVVKAERPAKPPKEPKVLKEKKPRKKWSRRRKFLVTIGVLAVVISGTYYYVHKTLTGPATGTVITSIPGTDKKSEVELEQFDGKLFSFVHPVMFAEQAQKPGQTQNNLEAHTFVGSQMMTQFITVVITALPSRNAEDDASFKARLLDKDQYKKKETVIKNEKVTIFTSDASNQMQQAAFWVHGDKLLTFVMSGAAVDPQETISQYNSMLTSISWR